MREHLRDLSRDNFAHYVNSGLIPKHVPGTAAEVAAIMLKDYHVQMPVTPQTCGAWMLRCGAKYCRKTQNFYCDNHEKLEVVEYREVYIERDIGTLEQPSPRELGQLQWIQMVKSKGDEFQLLHTADGAAAKFESEAYVYTAAACIPVGADGIVCAEATRAWSESWNTSKASFPVGADGKVTAQATESWEASHRWGIKTAQPLPFYMVAAGEQMVEYHVESSDLLDDWREKQFMGGNLSVRHLPCLPPIVVWGQDESNFQADSARGMMWTVGGLSALTPKSGPSLMVSAFTSGSFGFRFPLTTEQLSTVNEFRQKPENCTFKCAQFGAPQALCVIAGLPESDQKMDLKETPGVRMIYNNKAADGYWNSSHMMVQTEDMVDCMRALFPWLKIIFEFDWSGVHGVMKKDALKVDKMSARFGGAQTLKRPTTMTTGCLGPFPAMRMVNGELTDVKLKVGDVQHMVFQEDDLAPWYALDTPKEDTPTGELVPPKKSRKKKKKNKTAELMERLDAVAAPVEEAVLVPGMKLGYVSKAKGLNDVLFERGWLNPAKLGGYTIKGAKGAGGVIDESTSLAKLMAECEDFKTETTAMHDLMEVLGVEMDQTPKCHPELAGRGVEYCWGKSKYEHRKHNTLAAGKAPFEKRVHAALESVGLSRSRSFLRKANDYKRAYRALNLASGAAAAVAHADIEKMRKLTKAHRCTFDQDRKFIIDA
jgi:hypothetical protein